MLALVAFLDEVADDSCNFFVYPLGKDKGKEMVGSCHYKNHFGEHRATRFSKILTHPPRQPSHNFVNEG